MAEKLTSELEMLEGEERLTQLGELQLTSKRLAYTGRARRGTLTTAAMLEDVDSATIQKRRASAALIVIGAILVFAGLVTPTGYYIRGYAGYYIRGYNWIPLLIGVIMVALFFLLGRRVVQFTIGGADWLTLSVRKLGTREKVGDFINKFFELKDRLSKG